MDRTSGRDNDTTKSPSPPDVKSNSTNIPSQSRTTLTNSGSRPANNRTTAVPAAVPKDRQAPTQRKDTSKIHVELDAQPRADQVSPRVAVVTYTCDSYL